MGQDISGTSYPLYSEGVRDEDGELGAMVDTPLEEVLGLLRLGALDPHDVVGIVRKLLSLKWTLDEILEDSAVPGLREQVRQTVERIQSETER